MVHEFRNEDPNCASLHPMGFQVSLQFSSERCFFRNSMGAVGAATAGM